MRYSDIEIPDYIDEAESLASSGKIAEAIACYERAAEVPSEASDALYMLYRLYRFRLHDYNSAEKVLQRMIELNPISRYDYADMLLDDRSSIYDASKAVALLKYVYENANSEDAYERVSWSLSAKALGDCYRLGKGVGKDEEKAVALYTEAAEDGNVGAKHILALRSWARGDGVDTLKWLGLSSSERQWLDSLSLALMGIIYSDSPFADVATDRKLAVKYFKLAAKEKNAYAMTETGNNYRLANHLKENPEEAAFWYRCAAIQGDEDGMNNYGVCWERGYGVPKSYKVAASWCETASKCGCSVATHNLAKAVERGRGVSADEKKAFELYKAAALSDDQAGNMYNDLGACYCDSIGTEKNVNKEYEMFRRGAVAGNCHALCGYARCFIDGNGVPLDHIKAEYIMKSMAEDGYRHAYYELALMYFKAGDDPVAKKKAFEYCKLGAAYGQRSAMKELERCYRNGYGVERDDEKADAIAEELAAMPEKTETGICRIMPIDSVCTEAKKLCGSEDTFKSFLEDICIDSETVHNWMYLIDSNLAIMHNVAGLALKILCGDSDSEQPERRKLTTEEMRSLKEFVYLCCETELRLLVRYEGPTSIEKTDADITPGRVYPVLKVTETGDYILADDSGEDWTYDGEKFTVVFAEGKSLSDGTVQLRLGEKEEKRGDFCRAMEHYSKGVGLGCILCGEAMIRCYDRYEKSDAKKSGNVLADEPGKQDYSDGVFKEKWEISLSNDKFSEKTALKYAEVAEHYRKAAVKGNIKATAALIHLQKMGVVDEKYDGETSDLLAKLEEVDV